MNSFDPYYKKIIQRLMEKGVIHTSPDPELGHVELLKLLIENGLSGKELSITAADILGYDFADIENMEIQKEVVAKIPINICRQHSVLPINFTDLGLHVVTANYFDSSLIDKLSNITQLPISISFGDYELINKYLYDEYGTSLAVAGLHSATDNIQNSEFYELEENSSENLVNIVNTLLLDALNKKASDIHIETYSTSTKVKYRLDGVLINSTAKINPADHSGIVSRIKVMSDLDISENRVPQDGRFSVMYQGRIIDIRTSLVPSIHGEDVVLRILDRTGLTEDNNNLSISALELENEERNFLMRMSQIPYGMLLITGPTGSGKTTTLYAILNGLDLEQNKIITIEDPVEYQLDDVVQMQVDAKKGLTFASGLRSVLRHDPDVILVGEIRDKETAEIAVQSAMTGHLVLSSVHANNSIDVINRLSHIGVDRYSFISALNGIVAQRLVRKLCDMCKEELVITSEIAKVHGLDASWVDKVIYKENGCFECNNTGYKGRTVIMEILKLSPELKDLIINKAPYSEIYKSACDNGMTNLRHAALSKLKNGITSLSEVERVTLSE